MNAVETVLAYLIAGLMVFWPVILGGVLALLWRRRRAVRRRA